MYDLLLKKFQDGHFGEIISLSESNGLTTGTDPRSLHVVAASHFSLGQIPQALEILLELESSLCDDEGYLGLYGAVLRRSGSFAKAEEVFLRAIKASPTSPVLRNNYANLLIDMERYVEAEDLLNDVLLQLPNYSDASNNLQRIKTLRGLQPLKQSSDTTSGQNVNPPSESPSLLLDPLLMAFDQAEVREHGRLKPISGLKSVCSKVPNRDIASDKLRMAQKAVSESNPSFALDLCSQAYNELGVDSDLLACVSDAYISSNRFFEAEITLLHSMLKSGPTLKHYINLVSFASMRMDFQLAEYYFAKASCLDSTNPNLGQVRKLLDSRKSSAGKSIYEFTTMPSQTPLSKA